MVREVSDAIRAMLSDNGFKNDIRGELDAILQHAALIYGEQRGVWAR